MRRPTNTCCVAGTRWADANRFIQPKLPISSAVSNTAGTTTENEIVESKLNWSGVNRSRPRYSQFAERTLISSNNHHTGAESAKSNTKFLRERVQIESPTRRCTRASTIKIYPIQSGKNR